MIYQRELLSSIVAIGLAVGCGENPASIENGSAPIVGGQTTAITELPWQVSLQSRSGYHFCGGTIISPSWIVTAAHCVDGGPPARILAGATRLSQAASGQVVSVKQATQAQGYQDASDGRDFALVELEQPLNLNGTTVKAIRPLSPVDVAVGLESPGTMSTVSGWGSLSSGGNFPDSLQSVQIPIVSLADASADYGFNISADQIAAGVRGVGGVDSCQGDSGGPMVVTNADTGEVKLAGVVSWGNGCADPDYPGMYARASSFFAMADDAVGAGPPTADAGDDQVVDAGSSVGVDGSGSVDVGIGSIASHEWVQTLGMPVELTADGAVADFVAPTEAGEIELELTVTDDRGNTATDRVTITVEATVEPPIVPPRDPTDPPTSGDGSTTITGGCNGSGGSGSGLLILFAVALLARRRRVAG